MLTKIGLPVALAAVGAGTVLLVWKFVTDLAGQLVGYGLGGSFLALCALLVGTKLSRRRHPSETAPTETVTCDATGPPRPAEWGILVLLNGLAAVMAVAGIVEAGSSGDVSLLVFTGVGWLFIAGPTAGVFRRWWRFRR